MRARQNLEILKLGKVPVGHTCNVRFDAAESATIIIHAKRQVYIIRNRMDTKKNDKPPAPPQKPKPDENAPESKRSPDAGQDATSDNPVSPPTDLDALLAPLEHADLVELRSRLDKKLPPAPKPTGAPVQNIVLFLSILSCIVSMDPTAFALLLSFRHISAVLGDIIPGFCVFALAPTLLPFVLVSFSNPTRKAIDETAHEMRNLLALLGGARLENTSPQKKSHSH